MSPLPLYAGSGPELLTTIPAFGQDQVSRLPRLSATFDGPLLPATVHGGNIQLRSGEATIPLTLTLGVLAPQIEARMSSQLPLSANTTYHWQIKDLWDLDGDRMGEMWEVIFRTGNREAASFPEPEAPGWGDVQPILTAHCAFSRCHRGPKAALGLDLSTAEAVRDTAIGVNSKQYYRSSIDAEGGAGFSRLSDLRIVDVVSGKGRVGLSYLMYKIAGDRHILGERMPPASAGQEPLSFAQQAIIQAWIASGAPLW
ncbi:MAG: Ig-like domain-containing protein [Myxococcales bacterium]|nr:Ig-like domain-containing protein [Myxococcales bacterium]MCB9708402.1 Ig-like domain-containing protein [Myxococcales bacterium]